MCIVKTMCSVIFFYVAYKWFLIIWTDPLMDKMAKSKHMELGIPTDLKNLTRNLGTVPRAPIKRPITEILFILYFCPFSI